jgi:succinoglycan biosynthesis protein ExoL
MTGIAFFGHDAGDAAVRRRVQGFLDDGLDVTGFMMRRADVVNAAWNNVDLGRTHDGAYAQRVRQVFAGARIAARHRDRLAAADLIYARNLDMLGLAFEAKRLTGLKTPVIYESLDVHRLLTRNDPIGLVFRRIEGALLARCRRLVVSSPAFLANHFETRHRGRYQAVLVENRLAAGADYGSRPEQRATPQAAGGPLRVGWMGILRCSRSLNLLLNLADQLGDRVQVVLHGVPALTEIPDFHDRIQNRPNVLFHGRYRAPEDLARIYSGVDLVWAGDFMEAGFNSVWLLPNRIYEGGYYAVPAIAPAGTETGRWIEARQAGFIIPEDLLATLPDLVAGLDRDRAPIEAARIRLLSLPDETFIQPRGMLKRIVEDALADA